MSRIKTLTKRIWDKRDLLSADNLTKTKGYFWYNKNYKKFPIKSNTILFEGRQGADLQGNVFYLLKEAIETTDMDCYLAVTSKAKSKVNGILTQYHMDKRVKLVSYGSVKYYKLLATAKYLVTDVTFPTNFIRREGQVYLNTWHGVPLKAMGRQSKDARMIMGNIQRNFMQASILLYPNQYTEDIMVEGYAIDKLCPNVDRVIKAYPRDRIFTTQKERFGTDTTKVYAYLPTWREHPIMPMTDVLSGIDMSCPEDVIVYARLHPLDKGNVDWSSLKHVKPAPNEYELNDMLSRCDGLITDYSSILFDYAYSNKPIVLYQYDKEVYEAERGLNFDIDLPVTKAPQGIFDLLAEKPAYQDYMSQFCPKFDGTSLLNEMMSWKEKKSSVTEPVILLYLGNLNKNGITTAGITLANYLAKNHTVVVTTPMAKSKKNGYALDRLDGNVIYYPMAESFLGHGSCSDFIKSMIYLFRAKGFESIKDFYEKNSERIQKTYFRNMNIANIIQYTGYEFDKIMLMANMNAESKSIFVHNDMESEVYSKGTLQKETLEYAYNKYDNIVIVSEATRKPTETFAKENKGKIIHIPNLIDTNYLKERGNEPIEFEQDTVCDLTSHELKEGMAKADYRFVTIGRFSKEKCHDRLIEAFKIVQKKTDRRVWMTIIGGYGEEFAKTVEKAKTATNILCIKSINNPQPILKESDCFVLVSDYEAQPLVLYEAKIQGCQLIATDIPTSRKVIEEIGGTLVDKESEKIAESMLQMMGMEKANSIEREFTYDNKKVEVALDGIFSMQSKK